MRTMSLAEKKWLSLAEASEVVGVHPTTLRRWADAGSVPCLRTPGGHRRFRAEDLEAWMEPQQTMALSLRPEILVQSALGFTRQEMGEKRVSGESWYLAFDQEADRQQMRDTGRHLFGLAIQYLGRTRGRGSILEEGQRIGRFYGEACARHEVGLANATRAMFFFRESLLRTVQSGQIVAGQYDAEGVHIQQQLVHFMNEIMFAFLDGYEATCRGLHLGAL
jgi:excisionase family DNA binding protein